MTRARTLSSLVLASALTGGCEPEHPETPVVLNERIFALPSMLSAGKGCTTYQLAWPGSHELTVEPDRGGNIPGLIVSQRSGGAVAVVQVTEDGRVVAERRYGEAFFRSGEVDELQVEARSGERKLLRYWGALTTKGVAACTPFEDDSPK
jgi:hypothetical protein